MPNRPIVGRKAFSNFVQQMREAYPDLSYDVGEVSFHMNLGARTRNVSIFAPFLQALQHVIVA